VLVAAKRTGKVRRTERASCRNSEDAGEFVFQFFPKWVFVLENFFQNDD